MKKFYISTFLASMLLITSCAEEKGSVPAPETGPCTPVTITIPPGQDYSVDGVSATAGPDGATVTGCAPQQ